MFKNVDVLDLSLDGGTFTRWAAERGAAVINASRDATSIDTVANLAEVWDQDVHSLATSNPEAFDFVAFVGFSGGSLPALVEAVAPLIKPAGLFLITFRRAHLATPLSLPLEKFAETLFAPMTLVSLAEAAPRHTAWFGMPHGRGRRINEPELRILARKSGAPTWSPRAYDRGPQ